MSETKPNQLVHHCDGMYASEARRDNDDGLTKREHMSIEFLKGILSAQTEMRANGRQPDKIEMDNYCLEAVEWADKLIKTLNSVTP